MGEAKQLLRLGETTLLDQVTENVRGSRVDEIVLVLGHEAETIKRSIATKSLRVLVNDSYGQGMGTSAANGTIGFILRGGRRTDRFGGSAVRSLCNL